MAVLPQALLLECRVGPDPAFDPKAGDILEGSTVRECTWDNQALGAGRKREQPFTVGQHLCLLLEKARPREGR